MSEDREFVMDHCGLVRETEEAKLYRLGKGPFDKRVWIPKSLIVEEDDDTVTIPEWFAVKEGLE